MGNGHWHAMGWDAGIWPWFSGFHGVLWIALLAVIVFAVVHLVRGSRHNPEYDAALAALGEEYARGRISRDEFLVRRDDLAN